MLQTKEIEILFRTYYRPLCLYALHYLGDPDAVEDVVQESFTALWRQENPVANARAWLYSAVRNRSIDSLRKTGKTELLPSDLDGPISDDEAEERSALEARLWTAVDAFDQSGLRPDNQGIRRRTGAAGRQRGPDGHGRHGGPGAKNREHLFHSQR